MEKEKVIQLIKEAIKSFEDGTWTVPGMMIAILTALGYIVEKQ